MKKPHSRQTSLQNRLLLGIGVMLVPLLALGVGAFVCLDNAVKAFEKTAQEMEMEIFPLTRLQRLIESASNAAEEYIVNAEPTQRDRFIHLSHQVDNTFKNTLPFDEPQERTLFIAAQNEWQQARMTSEVIFARTHLVEGKNAVPEMERLERQLNKHTDQAVKLIDQIYDVSHLEIKEDLVRAYAVKQRGLLIVAITCGLGLLTVLVVSIVLARSILVPLGILSGGVSRFGEGELDYRIVLKTRDELGELAKMFNLMASRLEQSYAALKDSANIDPLTGLPNRTLFLDRLEQAVVQAKRRSDYVFAILFFDIDRFKLVNDSLGHKVGDELLIAIARRVKMCLRDGDTIARLGGDEFAILLNNTIDVSYATYIAERIKQELMKPFNLSGQDVFTSASIGVVLGSKADGWLDDILRNADIAMYHAKALGKARYQVYDTTLARQAVTRLQMETDLQKAIRNQEFQVHYQPIVLLETGRVTGFEALLRWEHPERGLISPESFISVAEETGAIVPIGYWVLHEACRQMRAWQVQFPIYPPLTISVNLSVKQFTPPELIKQIAQVIHETNLDASSLILEITESVLIENAESATTLLKQLKTLGIQLYLDDFGTGYSSLSYLHRFPIDALKIDRSFVSGLNGCESVEIVQAITMLAHTLGMDVIAEGVETQAQLAQLRALQCKYGQGYFFFKPLDAATAGAMITQKLSAVSAEY